jgi:hypothetical protein
VINYETCDKELKKCLTLINKLQLSTKGIIVPYLKKMKIAMNGRKKEFK